MWLSLAHGQSDVELNSEEGAFRMNSKPSKGTWPRLLQYVMVTFLILFIAGGGTVVPGGADQAQAAVPPMGPNQQITPGEAKTGGFVIINEIDSDTPGTDIAEFIELYDGGAGNTPLSGLAVVLYNGNDDLSYFAIDLDG